MSIERVIDLLRGAQSILFVTGAGLSADSGLPTYRGIGGLYNNGPTEEGIAIEDVLSGPMFRSRPELTWSYLRKLEQACRGATHNRGHQVIADLETRFDRIWTLTQNVDGFHRAAGSSNVIDIHGDLHALCCASCHYRDTVADYATLATLPRCPQCGDVVRPDVVLFGEMLPQNKLRALSDELDKGFDVVFSVGTTAVFPYIAGPVVAAKHSGIPTVEINPAKTDLSDVVDVRLATRAAQTFDAIWCALVS